MTKPVLVILAAGLGSRYGGLKQIDPVDEAGHIIIDYSIYDAYQAGFEKVICVITPQLESDFNEVIGKRVSNYVDLQYALQRKEDLPKGYPLPEGRVKPWGTAHAVLSARDMINGPFAVINADDFYGAAAFKQICRFLNEEADDHHYAMVGYQIENTLTENGYVSRGICKLDKDNKLLEISEQTHIEARPGGAVSMEDNKKHTFLPAGTVVSMNLWGFGQSFVEEAANRFSAFLFEKVPANPLGCEYFLPSVSNALLKEGKAEIKVIPSAEKWYGVTYPEDMPVVRSAIAAMKEQGRYPKRLWGKEE